jgi:hypothetical protein
MLSSSVGETDPGFLDCLSPPLRRRRPSSIVALPLHSPFPSLPPHIRTHARAHTQDRAGCAPVRTQRHTHLITNSRTQAFSQTAAHTFVARLSCVRSRADGFRMRTFKHAPSNSLKGGVSPQTGSPADWLARRLARPQTGSPANWLARKLARPQTGSPAFAVGRPAPSRPVSSEVILAAIAPGKEGTEGGSLHPGLHCGHFGSNHAICFHSSNSIMAGEGGLRVQPGPSTSLTSSPCSFLSAGEGGLRVHQGLGPRGLVRHPLRRRHLLPTRRPMSNLLIRPALNGSELLLARPPSILSLPASG